MEMRKDMVDGLKTLKASYGWQILQEKLKEDRLVAMNTFMRAQSMEDVAAIKAKIMIIDWVITMPDALINQCEGDGAELVDVLSSAEPVVSASGFQSA